jgi:peroxiredoxin Q/BCP
VSLEELLARGPVVLYFYPKDETTGCTVEACGFRDTYPELRAAGAEVVGVSRDDERSHAAFAAHHQLPFLLLTDAGGAVHAAYGVRQLLMLKDRVTFVIGREGIVHHVFDSKLRWRAHVDEAVAAVRKLPPPPR